MAPPSSKKRKVEDGIRGKTDRPKKRFRKQRHYHSSSEEEDGREQQRFTPVNLNDSDDEQVPKNKARVAVNKKKPEPVVAQYESSEETGAE